MLTKNEQVIIDEALIIAAEEGDKDGVNKALELGADIGVNENKAIWEAIKKGHNHIVKLLLDKSAAQNLPLKDAADRYYKDELSYKNPYHHPYNGPSSSNPFYETVNKALVGGAYFNKIEIVVLALENGANTLDNFGRSLGWAAEQGFTEIAALLLEKGFDPTTLDKLKLDHETNQPALALLNAQPELEKLADEYKDSGTKDAVRSAVYQSAAIAAKLNFDADGIAGFTRRVMQRSLEDTPLSRIPRYKAIDPLQLTILEKQAAHPLDAIAERTGIQGYRQASGIADMVAEYTDSVLLPQLLLDSGVAKHRKILAAMDDTELKRWSAKLLPIAVSQLLDGHRLDEIVQLGASWHRPGNAIPDHLRPLRGGKWQALMDEITCPSELGEDLSIRALSSQDELKKESDTLDHCVGRADYGSKCQEGAIHILSVRQNGVPLATAEIKFNGDEKSPISVAQFKGAHNATDNAIALPARKAWEWFMKKAGQGEVDFHAPINSQWGRIHQAGQYPPAIERIGFIPAQQNIDACVDHYRQHLLLKESSPTYKQVESPSFAARYAEEKSYNWHSGVQSPDMSGQDWKALVTEIQNEKSIPHREATSSWMQFIRLPAFLAGKRKTQAVSL
jgi:hypothetical protein